jgi:hypothetical protein
MFFCSPLWLTPWAMAGVVANARTATATALIPKPVRVMPDLDIAPPLVETRFSFGLRRMQKPARPRCRRAQDLPPLHPL